MMETAREYKGYHRGMSGAWFDARGCLSAEGVSAILDAPPGAAPEELAGHVAGCAHCQQRLLALESGPRPPRKPESPRWRNLALFGAGLLLALVGMAMTAWIVR
jgi:hypothetical protein